MPRYVVQHSYTAKRDGQQYGPWVPGTAVELHEYDAEWVNRDSPGCLGDTIAQHEEERPSADELTTSPRSGDTPSPDEPDGHKDDSAASKSEDGGRADSDVVPDGTAQIVLAWVGDDPDRARRALDVEKSKEQPRATLVATLERMASATLDRQHRGSRNRAVG